MPHHILNPASFQLEELSYESSLNSIAAAKELLLEYGQFVAAQRNVATFCYGALITEASGLPGTYLSQSGGAILASRIDSPLDQTAALGFIAWRSLPSQELSHAKEIKRLWVRPQARGLGLGRALVHAVIDRARAAGAQELFLDTAPVAMHSAYRLYRDLGFTECPSYQAQSAEGIVYMRMPI